MDVTFNKNGVVFGVTAPDGSEVLVNGKVVVAKLDGGKTTTTGGGTSSTNGGSGYGSELVPILTQMGKTRNGNYYDKRTGARMTFLNPANGDLAYRYEDVKGDDESGWFELATASNAYNGTVEAINIDGSRERFVTSKQQPEPIDYFKRMPDGSMVRSDKDGNINPALEFLRGDDSGVVAIGEVGPGAGGSTRDAPTQEKDWTPILRDGNGQYKAGGMTPSIKIGRGGFAVPFRTPKTSPHDRALPGGGGQFNVEPGTATPPQDFDWAVAFGGTYGADGKMIGGTVISLGRSNALHTGWGMGEGSDKKVPALPLNTNALLIGVPVDLTANARGETPDVHVEIAMPGRPANYGW